MSSFRSNRASRSRERHKNRNGGDRSHRDRRHSPRDRLANVTVRTSSRTRTAYHPLSDSAQRWSDKSRTPSVSPSDEDSDDPDDPDKEGLITFQPGDELRSGRCKCMVLLGCSASAACARFNSSLFSAQTKFLVLLAKAPLARCSMFSTPSTTRGSR